MSKKKTLKKTFYAILLALSVLVVWGLIEPRLILDETHRQATIPRLPDAWKGEKIAIIADIQIGMWMANENMVQRAVERIVEERPAAALLVGDFLYGPIDEESTQEAKNEIEQEDLKELQQQIQEVLSLIRPLLTAGIPTYAVLGNHDYLMEEKDEVGSVKVADDLAQALRQAGVIVLRNEAVRLNKDGAPLYLGGVDSLMAGVAKPEKVLAAIPDEAPRIIMTHNPDVFEKLPANSVPLAVAGHTHGGQVRIPGFPEWSWMALKSKDEITADGWIEGYGAPGNHLYVNRGIGFSRWPIRIACPPELTWMTLLPSQ